MGSCVLPVIVLAGFGFVLCGFGACGAFGFSWFLVSLYWWLVCWYVWLRSRFPGKLDLCCFVVCLLWAGLVIAGLGLMADLLFVLCVVAFWVGFLSGLVRDGFGVFCVLCFGYVCFCGFGLFAFVLLLIWMVWWVVGMLLL